MSKLNGFTLTEVVVASGIAMVVGVLLVSILVSNTGLYYTESSKVQQGLGINDSLSKIRSNIKEAQFIAAQYPESGSPEFSSSANQLVLKLASIDSSGNIITDTYDFFVYYPDQDKLKLKVFPNDYSEREVGDQILSKNVSSILFQYFDSTGQVVAPVSAVKVKTTLTLSQKAGSSYQSHIATSEANLRND